MSVVGLRDVEKSYGADTVLAGASFTLEMGDRAGLIGVNGSGKTTILKLISGEMEPDKGQVALTRDISIGLLTQEAGKDGGGTLLEEMLSSRPEILALRRRLDKFSVKVGELAHNGDEGYDDALAEYSRLIEQYEAEGGYVYDNLVTGALAGLGFDKDEFDRPVGTLSGGQRTRLALAKLLLAGHDLLMLDEPTNHLDIHSIAWLEEFLRQYRGTVLLVSHDRYFLDRVTNRTLELYSGAVEDYPGNYSVYQIEKEKRTADRLRQYELISARLEKEKEYINRMRAGVHARQAKGREKRLKRFEMPDRPDTGSRSMKLGWTDTARSADTVIKVEGLGVSLGGKEILDDVSFTLRRGERIGMVGRNGGGKSTLLKAVLGVIEQDKGTVTLGPNVQPAYYAQGLEGLSDENTVMDELWAVEPMAVEQKIRDMLGSFLFTGDDAKKKVGVLSGGEKGRLAIAKIVLAGANLLVLDEPTNHLDIPSRETLEHALTNFEGTVLAVSHDRYFLDKVVDKIYEVEGGRLNEYWGNYTYYAARKTEQAVEAAKTPTEGRQAWEGRKQQQADERRREREVKLRTEKIEGIEGSIEELEAGLRDAERTLADPVVYGDYAKVDELTRRYDELKAKRDELYGLLEKELS